MMNIYYSALENTAQTNLKLKMATIGISLKVIIDTYAFGKWVWQMMEDKTIL